MPRHRPLRQLLVVLLLTCAAESAHCAEESGDVPAKVERYAARMLMLFDADQSGQLESAEWQQLRGDPQQIDRDGDDVITTGELVRHILNYGRSRRLGSRTAADDEAEDGQRRASDAVAPGQLPRDAGPQRPGEQRDEAVKDATAETKLEQRRRNLKFYVRPERLPANVPSWFISRDEDGDAQLTLNEFTKDGAGQATEFRRLDRNRDGLVTAAEVVSKQP